VLGWVVFSAMAAGIARLKRPLRGLEKACEGKFFFDELWRELLLRPTYATARVCAAFDRDGVDGLVNAVGAGGRMASRVSGAHDQIVVDGMVNGVGEVAQAGGAGMSALQNGRVRFYLSVAVGVLAAALVLHRLL
jgi:hypothetical protein